MSELKTNTIATNDANNVAMDNALKLKSYTTTQRDALTSVAGDTIYNSTTSKVQVYNGSSWDDLGGPAVVKVDYVVIGGGASGGGCSGSGDGGGGGAGGYLSHYASENSGGGNTNSFDHYIPVSTTVPITIGAGGAAGTSGRFIGLRGNETHFGNLSAVGGGAGGTWAGKWGDQSVSYYPYTMTKGGSGGGDGSISLQNGVAPGTLNQGYAGGQGNNTNTAANRAAAGGGGAGGVGASTDNSATSGGAGGAGVSSSITGSAVERAGGGGGGCGSGGGAGSAGGGNGGANSTGTAASANTGSGGGGAGSSTSGNRVGSAGGSGVIILRYPNTFTISQSGLTLSTATDGSDKVTTITAGTGTVSFA